MQVSSSKKWLSKPALEIEKGRFGFKLTAPYSEDRRKAASTLAKKNGVKSGR